MSEERKPMAKRKQLTKATATEAANVLLRQMNTQGWNIKVWENLGWHYCLKLGDSGLSLSYCDMDATYSCLLSDRAEVLHGGMSWWLDRGSYKDPNKAVNGQLKLASEFINKLTTHVDGVTRVLLGAEYSGKPKPKTKKKPKKKAK